MFSNTLVLKILDYIDNNLYKKITIEELSRTFYFNKDYIMRVFKREIKSTIIEYINKKRIFTSLNELKNTNNSILKIAINNGFISQEYYSETFTKIVGVNPLTYKKFTKVGSNISYDKINIIRNSIAKLNLELNIIKEYRRNVPTKQVKTLSLFK